MLSDGLRSNHKHGNVCTRYTLNDFRHNRVSTGHIFSCRRCCITTVKNTGLDMKTTYAQSHAERKSLPLSSQKTKQFVTTREKNNGDEHNEHYSNNGNAINSNISHTRHAVNKCTAYRIDYSVSYNKERVLRKWG